MLYETVFRQDLHFREALLPDLSRVPKVLLCPIREIAFHHLYCFLNTEFGRKTKKDMNVVRHHDKIMHFEFLLSHVRAENFDEEIGHTRGLKNRSAPAGSGAYKKRADWVASRIMP